MAGGDMPRNKQNIPHSAKYTAATWVWGKFPCAQLTAPKDAGQVFRVVNAYMRLYRLINPKKYSLHHTLLHRHAMINYLLRRAELPQVVEVAAGFSPRGSAVSEAGNVNYYEVDLEDVVALKRDQLNQSEQGRAILARQNFQQKSADIRYLNFCAEFAAIPSFFITEGLMMYFHRQEQMAIWQQLAAFIKQHGGEYVFDYISLDIEPERSVVGQALHRLKKRLGGGDAGYCYDNRSIGDVKSDLLAAGFNQVDVYESSQVAAAWKLPESQVKTRVAVYHCR